MDGMKQRQEIASVHLLAGSNSRRGSVEVFIASSHVDTDTDHRQKHRSVSEQRGRSKVAEEATVSKYNNVEQSACRCS